MSSPLSKKATGSLWPFFLTRLYPFHRSLQRREASRQRREHPIRDGRHTIRDGRHPVRDGRHPIRDGRHPVRDGRHPVRDGRHPVRDGRHPVFTNHLNGRLSSGRWPPGLSGRPRCLRAVFCPVKACVALRNAA